MREAHSTQRVFSFLQLLFLSLAYMAGWEAPIGSVKISILFDQGPHPLQTYSCRPTSVADWEIDILAAKEPLSGLSQWRSTSPLLGHVDRLGRCNGAVCINGRDVVDPADCWCPISCTPHLLLMPRDAEMTRFSQWTAALAPTNFRKVITYIQGQKSPWIGARSCTNREQHG